MTPRAFVGAAALLLSLVGCGDRAEQADTPGDSTTPPPAATAEILDSVSAPSDVADDSVAAAWTSGVATAPATATFPPVLVTALRTGRHPDFERVVIELEGGGGFPEYKVEYIDKPLRDCGAGNEIFPVGDGWLEIRLYPADAHTQQGQPTISHRPRDLPGLDNLLRVYTTCDFEAVTTLVLAMKSPNEFRVLELSDPGRIVVDVRK